jgi:uncharacterized SAM-binding protein YcdF (DUF218 family)
LLRFFKYFLIFHLVLILLFAAGGRWVINTGAKMYKEGIKQQPYDVIIVPGYGYTPGPWSKVIEMRMLWAKHLYQRGYAKNVIFSGSAVYSPYVESKIMALYALEMGIPADHIFTEEQAEHSTENVYYSYLLAREKGFKKIALATDPFQTLSLKRFISRFEIPVDYLPIFYRVLDSMDHTQPVIVDSLALRKDFVALPDREGRWERFRGTMGKHIIWRKQDQDSNSTGDGSGSAR